MEVKWNDKATRSHWNIFMAVYMTKTVIRVCPAVYANEAPKDRVITNRNEGIHAIRPLLEIGQDGGKVNVTARDFTDLYELFSPTCRDIIKN